MKDITKILFGALVIPIGLLIYNFVSCIINNTESNFFITPLYAIINMLIAITVAYYFTQCRNDKQKKREIAESVINKILISLSNRYMCDIQNNEDVALIRITQRSISNRLDLLNEYEKDFNNAESLKYAKEQYEFYWDTISSHIDDLEHLKKMNKDLFNLVTKIENCLERMIIDLYKN